MLSPIYYSTVYLLIVTIFYLRYYYYSSRNVLPVEENGYTGLLLCIVMVAFIGFRPVHPIFADTVGYNDAYNLYRYGEYKFEWETDNLLFDNFLLFVAKQHLGISFFFVSISAIFFGGIFLSSKLMFPEHPNSAFVAYLASFSTYSYSVNGIKAGAAAAIFLIGVAVADRKKWMSVFLCLLSYTFHHSMFVCVIAFLLVRFFKKSKYYFAFWFFCLLMALLHVTFFQSLFGGMSFLDEQKKLGDYLLNQDDALGWRSSGFRMDFVLYSSAPIVIGYWAKYKLLVEDKYYDFLINLYLLLNGVWMLCMYANFTNRIAFLSWMLYPFVLFYPFYKREIRCKNESILGWVSFLFIGFTSFMYVFYYGLSSLLFG